MIRWAKSMLGLAAPLLAVVGVVAFFAFVDVILHGEEATFLSLQNLQSISVQNAFVAICSLGMLLVIISGGIDLSAGAALALCATIFAWGLREDVGLLISRGENLASAAAGLKAAEDSLRDAKDANEGERIASATKEVADRRAGVIEILQPKKSQLEGAREKADDDLRNLERRISDMDQAIRDVTNSERPVLRSIERLQLKRSRLSAAREKAHDDLRNLERRITDIEQAIRDVTNAERPILSNPAWLRSAPNARSTAWLAIAMCVGTGMLCGLLNGVLIVALRVVPFIATLGTMSFFLGLGLIVADETSVSPTSVQIPSWLGELSAVRPDPEWLMVSKGVWMALVLAAMIAIVLKYTVFGRHVFALGSSEATARLCGINVSLVKICVYVLAGALVGLAAVCYFARMNSGKPTDGPGLELKFIAAVVIGGASLSGGRGTVLGTLAGTAIMGVIASGGTLLGLRAPTQYIALGVIVIAAVAADQLRKSRNS